MVSVQSRLLQFITNGLAGLCCCFVVVVVIVVFSNPDLLMKYSYSLARHTPQSVHVTVRLEILLSVACRVLAQGDMMRMRKH